MSRIKIIVLFSFFLALLVLLAGKVLAEEKAKENLLDLTIKHFYNHGKSLAISPFHWDKGERMRFFLVISATAGLFLLDEELQDMVQRNRSRFSDDLARLATPSEHIYPKVVISGFYLGGLLFKRKKEKDVAFDLLEAVIFSQALTQGIKHLTGRARPLADEGAFSFEGLKAHPSPYSLSFPSGHSNTAFTLAAVIAEHYDNKIIDFIAYSLASLAAWARVNDNAHFVSDVFFGGILGVWVGKSIVGFHQNQERRSRSLALRTKVGFDSVKISLNF